MRDIFLTRSYSLMRGKKNDLFNFIFIGVYKRLPAHDDRLLILLLFTGWRNEEKVSFRSCFFSTRHMRLLGTEKFNQIVILNHETSG